MSYFRLCPAAVRRNVESCISVLDQKNILNWTHNYLPEVGQSHRKKDAEEAVLPHRWDFMSTCDSDAHVTKDNMIDLQKIKCSNLRGIIL